MDKSDQAVRILAQQANLEARRRAGAVLRVTFIVVISVLATLVFSGHRIKSECYRALICIERGLH
jgi:hypothetical protein